MIFSVFDPYRRTYDYFEAPGTSANYGARGTKYRPLAGRAQVSGPIPTASGSERMVVGFLPEALLAPLPREARKVGSGPQARGLVARALEGEDALGALGATDLGQEEPPPVPVAVGGVVSFGQVIAASVVASVVGVFVQRALQKPKRER